MLVDTVRMTRSDFKTVNMEHFIHGILLNRLTVRRGGGGAALKKARLVQQSSTESVAEEPVQATTLSARPGAQASE